MMLTQGNKNKSHFDLELAKLSESKIRNWEWYEVNICISICYVG